MLPTMWFFILCNPDTNVISKIIIIASYLYIHSLHETNLCADCKTIVITLEVHVQTCHNLQVQYAIATTWSLLGNYQYLVCSQFYAKLACHNLVATYVLA